MNGSHDRKDDGQLLALAAHEFRSPVSAVAGYLRMLLKGHAGELPEAPRTMVEEANRSCSRLLHLIHELSDLAALKNADAPIASRTIEIFPLCDEVIRAAADTASLQVAFTCSVADRPAIVRGDAARLREALGSLLADVRRERGTASLDARGFVDRAGSPRAVIVFGSEGIGLPDDAVSIDRGDPFEPWRGGMGMALPLACCILEAHGGRVWSIPGREHKATALSLPLVEME